MKQIKLYGYCTSPYVRKTGCFLYYKGVNFTHVPVSPHDPAATLAHTHGTQVPVLEIDGEYRRESSNHAFWLDELFPDKPLCPPSHAPRIKELDEWVSNTFLLSIFRFAIDGDLNLNFRHNAWRLAALLNAQAPMPESIRHQWPEILKSAPFIQNMAEHMDLSESYPEMMRRISGELAEHIGDGPYIGGLSEPTMLDLAIFPQMVWGFLFGFADELSAAKHPTIGFWLKNVSKHLPQNPTLAPDDMQINFLHQVFD